MIRTPFVLGFAVASLAIWSAAGHAEESPSMGNASPVEAPAAAPAVTPGGAPNASQKIERFATRCTDFTTNGWAFKAPNNFLTWLDVFSDPAIWLEFARRGLDPQTFVATASSALEPATVRNYLEWTDPMIYSKWITAGGDPQFYTQVTSTLFDPGRFMRWVMLPLDPRPWDIAFRAASPETWMKWLNAPTDPKTQAFLNKAFDPETLNAWLRELQDPKNYPGAYAANTKQQAKPESTQLARR